jgi:hypothetical protein
VETVNLTFSQLITAVSRLSSPEKKEILNLLESEELQLNNKQQTIIRERQEGYLKGKMEIHSLEDIKKRFDFKD